MIERLNKLTRPHLNKINEENIKKITELENQIERLNKESNEWSDELIYNEQQRKIAQLKAENKKLNELINTDFIDISEHPKHIKMKDAMDDRIAQLEAENKRLSDLFHPSVLGVSISRDERIVQLEKKNEELLQFKAKWNTLKNELFPIDKHLNSLQESDEVKESE